MKEFVILGGGPEIVFLLPAAVHEVIAGVDLGLLLLLQQTQLCVPFYSWFIVATHVSIDKHVH